MKMPTVLTLVSICLLLTACGGNGGFWLISLIA